MLGKIARCIFGSANDRFVKRQYRIVRQINQLEPEFEKLSDEELKNKTAEFKARLKNGEELMIFCRKLLPVSEKPQKELWGKDTMMFSWSAVLFCTKV